jgi:hypothetical protein
MPEFVEDQASFCPNSHGLYEVADFGPTQIRELVFGVFRDRMTGVHLEGMSTSVDKDIFVRIDAIGAATNGPHTSRIRPSEMSFL